MKRYRAIGIGIALALGIQPSATAATIQSDTFLGRLASFWKVRQIVRDTDVGKYGPASAQTSGGTLRMTSEGDGIGAKAFQPFLVYQENITGPFDIRVRVISGSGQDPWSGAGGLILMQSVPEKVVEADPSSYPSYWMVGATNGHGPEDKGGGQGRLRGNTRFDLGTETPPRPPYWLRMLRVGNSLWRFHSTDDGKTWIGDGPRVDLSRIRSGMADDVKPIQDPVAVGIVQQAQDGPGKPVTSVVGPFQASIVAAGYLNGMLCDLSGLPLPHASFRAIVASSPVVPVGTSIPIRTDANGEVREELPPGVYTLTPDATRRALSGFPMRVDVRPGQAAGIGIILAGDMPPFFEDGVGAAVEDEFPGGALNTAWTTLNIGTAGGSAGSASVANGVLIVAAGGHGVRAGRADVGYTGALRKVSGDFAATVQVLAVPDTQENAFAGLVVTPGADPFAPFALPYITPRHPVQQWVRAMAGANPIATLIPGSQGSTILPAWLKIRRVGETVAYWWVKDPEQDTPVFGRMELLDDFTAKEMLVGIAAGAAVADTSVTAGFRFAHFRLVPLSQ